MEKVIKTVFEKGQFRPIERVDLPEAAQVEIRIVATAVAPLDSGRTDDESRRAWADLAGIGDSGQADIGVRHDHYLYGDPRLQR